MPLPMPTSAGDARVPEPLFRLQHFSVGAPSLPLLRTSQHPRTRTGTTAARVPHAFVLVSGLGDTLGTLPYIPRLAHLLSQRAGPWELLLPTLSSTAGGWGSASLEGDARELGELIAFLRSEEDGQRAGTERHIVIQGHSTGCQDLVQLLSEQRAAPFGVPIAALPPSPAMDDNNNNNKDGKPTSPLRISAAILQAPVSDCEDFQHRVAHARSPSSKHAVAMLGLATKMVADGKGHELLPRSHVAVLRAEHGPPSWSLPSHTAPPTESTPTPSASDPIADAPVTAYRHHSLHSPGGDDDFFSSPALLPDDVLRKGRLARAIANAESSDTRILFLFSAQDQYVPEHLRTDAGTIRAQFLDRWEALQSPAANDRQLVRGIVVEGADHAVHDDEAQTAMLSHIASLLDDLSGQSNAP